MEPELLKKALDDLPPASLITEIPEIQNAIAHLLKSNQEMIEYDPNDPDLKQAIKENKDLIIRKEKHVDITLQVIRERLGEAAWREMGSNVKEFREIHAEALKETRRPDNTEEGVFL
ncbi:uncharacterized protein B0P05DRAFT_574383 [Gilbertella persicaria]|uniref:uncharacterized protein n=1 Tax=Gilbertella persicaria TaxID=101096 RepID=UPI0022206DF7|nr:uncharacterized protein B0P05DRAFT_574383 [Gilbertella persicaria]KAI8062782.1 hypothetical protein B0P05DRAFT_574383 [Gilbertella persicaria]